MAPVVRVAPPNFAVRRLCCCRICEGRMGPGHGKESVYSEAKRCRVDFMTHSVFIRKYIFLAYECDAKITYSYIFQILLKRIKMMILTQALRKKNLN